MTTGILELKSLAKKLDNISDPAEQNIIVQKYCSRDLRKQIKKCINKSAKGGDLINSLQIKINCQEPKFTKQVQNEVNRLLSSIQPTESRIFSYGALHPILDDFNLINEQLLHANWYYNKLIESERNRRERNNKIVQDNTVGLDVLENKYKNDWDTLQKSVQEAKDLNIKNRNRIQTSDVKELIKQLRKTHKESYGLYKETKKNAYSDPKLKDQLRFSDEKAENDRKVAYNTFPEVFWGTKLKRDQAFKASKSKSHKPPRFKRFDNSGAVAVQLQGGLSVKDFFAGKSTFIKINKVKENPNKKIKPKKSDKLYSLKIAVGKSSDGAFIYVEIPFVYHRPLPDTASIKWCYVLCERVATHFKWHVQFVIEGRPELFVKKQKPTTGIIGMDAGWRIVPEGLRVCFWSGDDGKQGQLIIPQKIIDRFHKSQELQSLRDDKHNVYKDIFIAWLNANKASDWIKEETKTIIKWKSPNSFFRFISRWAKNRFDGDEAIFNEMNIWRKQDRHLYDWAVFNKRKAIKWREEFYRNFAQEKGKTYSIIGVENVNWANLQKNKSVELQTESDKAISKNRAIAAPGLFISIMKEFSNSNVLDIDSAGTTSYHYKCNKPSGQIDKTALIHFCNNCKESFDRDVNGARQILIRTIERVHGKK